MPSAPSSDCYSAAERPELGGVAEDENLDAMKAFWVYTGLRLLLFLGSLALVVAVWGLISNPVQFIPALLLAALISSIASWRFLRVPRERFASQVQDRAARATARFEEIKAKEDVDCSGPTDLGQPVWYLAGSP